MQNKRNSWAVPILVLVIAIMACGVVAQRLLAQSPWVSTRPGSLINPWQIKPQFLPTALTNISSLPGGPPTGVDVYVCYIDLATAGTGGTVTIQDGQGTAMPFMSAVAVPINTSWIPLVAGVGSQNTCRWFPGGVFVQSGTGSAVSIHMSGLW